jgi:hypothetical protein
MRQAQGRPAGQGRAGAQDMTQKGEINQKLKFKM